MTTPPDGQRGASWPVEPEAEPTPRLPVVRLLLLLVAAAVVGVVGGVVWEWVWTPPTGVSIDGVWYLDGDGVRNDFSGTGVYVLVGLGAGLVLGVASALVTRSHEVLTLVVVAVGSVLAAALMAVVGPKLGPPDPAPLAEGQPDRTAIPSDLHIEGRAPYAALPAGALTGLALCFIGTSGSRRKGLNTEPDG